MESAQAFSRHNNSPEEELSFNYGTNPLTNDHFQSWDGPLNQNHNSAPERFKCIICNKPTQSCCSGCGNVFYCSTKHQQLHWEVHQFECSPAIPEYEERMDDILGKYESIKSKSPEPKKTQSPTPIKEKEKSNIPQMEASQTLAHSIKSEGVQPAQKKDPSSVEKGTMKASGNKKDLKKISKDVTSLDERKQKLSEAFDYYLKFDYEKAIIRAKRAYELSQLAAEKGKNFDPYQIIADGLLLAKFLISDDKMVPARQILLEVWMFAQRHLPENRITVGSDTEGGQKIIEEMGQSSGRGVYFNYDETISRENKKRIYGQIKKITSIFSSIAGLFSAAGDFVNCENAYQKYLKVIENNFGLESLEVSNVIFLLGAFFLENRQYSKSMECFEKVLCIRHKCYGNDTHESLADCYYNIAIIYKQNQQMKKALSSLNTALKIRVRAIGEVSLPVAQVLELAAKIHFEEGVYKEAFTKFQDCYIIRKKILHNSKHPDIIRVKEFLQTLYQKMEEIIEDKQAVEKQRELCMQIRNQMQKSPLYSDMIKELHGITPSAETHKKDDSGRTRQKKDKSPIRTENNTVQENSPRFNEFITRGSRDEEISKAPKVLDNISKTTPEYSSAKGTGAMKGGSNNNMLLNKLYTSEGGTKSPKAK